MLLPLLYFMQLNCRSYRYIILFLPFLVMLSGYGLSTLLSKLNKKKFFWSLIIILIISMSFAVTYSVLSEQPKQEPWQYQEFFRYADGEETTRERWRARTIMQPTNRVPKQQQAVERYVIQATLQWSKCVKHEELFLSPYDREILWGAQETGRLIVEYYVELSSRLFFYHSKYVFQ